MTCEHEYAVGDLVRVSAEFADGDANPIDPDDVCLNVRSPSGSIARHEYGEGPIVRNSIGHYHADIPVDRPGKWCYYWHSRGLGQAAEEGSFSVAKVQAA